jgi:hypothetical protein
MDRRVEASTVVGVIGALLVVAFLAFILWKVVSALFSAPVQVIVTDTPTGEAVIDTAVDTNRIVAHGEIVSSTGEARGTVDLVDLSDDLALHEYAVYFTDLTVDTTQNLRVYLSADGSVEDAVLIGNLKDGENDDRYDVPNDTDMSKYRQVIITSTVDQVNQNEQVIAHAQLQ